jgi:hypothetical protein
MKKLVSHKIELPLVYLVTDKSELKNIPIGLPFIFACQNQEKYLIRLLEYEVLYQSAIKTGYPFNFKKILKDAGYTDLIKWKYDKPPYLDYVTDFRNDYDIDNSITKQNLDNQYIFEKFVRDSAVIVDIQKLKDLKIFPSWLQDTEKALSVNIHNYTMYNPLMYNKKLDGMYGSIELGNPQRNLLNIDISSSIPKAIGTTFATMSKHLAESFYCDIIFTGRDTIFIPYEQLYDIDVEQIYDKYGNSQECKEFRRIITSDVKKYNTCIVMGDNHSVCGDWGYEKKISKKDGQKLNKFEINHLICFHTTEEGIIPGFADWFSPNTVEHIKNWKKYLD